MTERFLHLFDAPMSLSSNGSIPSLASPKALTPSIADVLPRPRVEIDRGRLSDWLSERTVLVTGAGGSIGTELSQQLAALRPRHLVMVDVSEYNLFQLETKFSAVGGHPDSSGLTPGSMSGADSGEPPDESGRGEREQSDTAGLATNGQQDLHRPHPDDARSFCIGDVRDRPLMQGLFEDFHPDVVLHAAAYKHVPLMERHPIEAFRNNTLATTSLLRLCQRYKTEQFVFVSTDKAVEPTSVLGATKRLAEWYVRSISTGLRCNIVRFGNVFGSQGSVVPLFLEQIINGGPLTVTHPEMERYFMSAHEACSLILQTLLLDNAPVYLFDMGEPVRIAWLARRLIQRLRPDIDAEHLIEYTGIRPGEKLHETLWGKHETSIATAHDHIVGITGPQAFSQATLEHYFKELEQLCRRRRPDALREALFAEDLEHTEHYV